MRKYLVLTLACLACVLPIGDQARASAMTAAEFVSFYRNGSDADRQMLDVALIAMNSGMLWANTAIKDRKQPALYCQPDRLTLTASQTISILENELKVSPYLAKFPYGLAILTAYQRVFPC